MFHPHSRRPRSSVFRLTPLLLTGCLLLGCLLVPGQTRGADRPNILWITSEDNGLELGCYGDEYATSPHIDALAADGLRYNFCWSTAPVCAPARTTIISGMYPQSLGAEHMRSLLPMPEGLKMYPQYLREQGYYCTNNSKEDYNLVKPDGVWDDSSRKAHWKNRAEGQPFFAIFNHTISHESQIRSRPHTPVHDPAGVRVPAFHPDIPETRRDWAQYYDKVTEMDKLVGKNVAELKEAGLYEETIIFYYGDHGSGMPRYKRWPYNTGLHVPLIVRFPEKYKHLAPPEYQTGGTSDRLVGFVDLAPTLLSICGIRPPEQLQGLAFAGPHRTENPRYIFGFRGRMDERIDMVRSARNERFVYLRHFYPHRPYGQYLNYMFQTPTTRAWYELHLEGKLTPEQDAFWREKPVEELYDLQNDPDEVRNLAEDPAYAETLGEFRDALGKWCQEIRDVGVLPEAEVHARIQGRSPYDLVRSGELVADYDRLLGAAFIATRAKFEDVGRGDVVDAFVDPEAGVRYWAALFALRCGKAGAESWRDQLLDCLEDDSPSVRIMAAEALGRYGESDDLERVLQVLVETADLRLHDVPTAIAAWNALDVLDDKAAPVRDKLAELPEKSSKPAPRMETYVPRLKEKVLADLDGKPLP